MTDSPAQCAVCGERGHQSHRCPELSAPLHQTGFYKPSGGGGHSHDDDDDDETTCQKLELTQVPPPGRVGAHDEDKYEINTPGCQITIAAPFALRASLPRPARRFWDVDMPSTCCV